MNFDAIVVDDQVDSRLLVESYLVKIGYNVTTASDGQEALDILRSNPNRFSVLVTDCMMPRMKGPCLIRKLYELEIQISTIILSSALSENDELISSILKDPAYSVTFIKKGTLDFGKKLELAASELFQKSVPIKVE